MTFTENREDKEGDEKDLRSVLTGIKRGTD